MILNLDNIVLNNYWRKYQTYLEIGWDDTSIKQYLSQKQLIMQVASFNTRTVSFSASSRRNRFYTIYNRLNMLDQDVAYGESINGLTRLASKYEIFVVSARSEELKEKTLETLSRLEFSMENLTICFKKPNDQLHNYRKRCIEKIHEKYPTGIGICLHPNDVMLFERYDYTPIAFNSLKDAKDFNGKVQVICHNWEHILTALNCNL